MLVLVIPAFNEEAVVGATVAALPPGLFGRVIVAANGCTDRTEDVARQAGAEVLSTPERGYGAACLAAIAYLAGEENGDDILLFLQADGSFSRRGFFRRGTLAANVFTLEFADKGRWVFRALDGSPAAGKIAQSIDRNGNALQFSYDGLGRHVFVNVNAKF